MIEKGSNEILDAIPERLIDWEKDGDGRLAVLLIPRFRKGLLAKWLQPRLKRPFVRITLDELGTFVWERCDGRKTVGEIVREMNAHFGEKARPAEERIKLFLSNLYRGRLIRYWQKSI